VTRGGAETRAATSPALAASTVSLISEFMARLARASRSDPPDDGAAEEAARLHQEHEDDQDQRHGQPQIGPDEADVRPGEVLDHTDQEASEDGAAGARESAEGRRGERADDDAAHHVRLEDEPRTHHHYEDEAAGARH